MEKHVDLFGFETVGLSLAQAELQAAPTRKAPVRVQIDRKQLWSTNSYGFGGIRQLDDDDEFAEAVSTSDTKSDNSTIEKLEQKLGLRPDIKDGKWVRDETGFQYRRFGTKFLGERKLGESGSMLRDLNKRMVLTSARSALEPLFNDPCCWIILASVGVLATRLHMMDADEDPYACLTAFMEVMAQHDFIDNQRSGDTIRSLTRRDNERDRRATKRAAKNTAKPKPPKETKISDRLMDDMESCDDFGDDGY